MNKEEKPITSFMWCGVTVCVYTQVVKFAGTTIQRHLLPTNLRRAVDQQVAGAANHQEARPYRIQHSQRREGNAEQQHYGVTARAMQRRARSSG
mgnify:CR=1 FL=1